MNLVDLHVHSTASDGTFTPAEVAHLAAETGLSAFALTDHDTVAGVDEALEAAEKEGIRAIPGAELSCPYEGKEIHILGLCLNHHDPELTGALMQLRKDRQERNLEMLDRFRKDGFDLSAEDLTGGHPDTVLTRAHFGRALVAKGYVKSMDQAFAGLLKTGGKYVPPKKNIPPEDAIRLIRHAGGFPSLAHPVQYKLGWKKTEELIALLKEMGLQGAEVYYSSHTPGDSRKLQEICRRYGLLPSGGSDFHGANKPDIRLGSGRGGLRVSALLLRDIENLLSAQKDIEI